MDIVTQSQLFFRRFNYQSNQLKNIEETLQNYHFKLYSSRPQTSQKKFNIPFRDSSADANQESKTLYNGQGCEQSNIFNTLFSPNKRTVKTGQIKINANLRQNNWISNQRQGRGIILEEEIEDQNGCANEQIREMKYQETQPKNSTKSKTISNLNDLNNS